MSLCDWSVLIMTICTVISWVTVITFMIIEIGRKDK